LRPIATDRELVTLDHTFGNYEETEVSYMQQYFYVFWISRNETESESEWLQYRDKVILVQREYGTRNKRGYETDRGRVFLKYGPPNDIQTVATEPSSYPYELWRYYRAGIYNNVKFVFYDPTLLGTDYELLHCDYIPGETNNPSWKEMLKMRTGTGVKEYGGRIDENFDNPR
jgi:GWxTD domain-containing protein